MNTIAIKMYNSATQQVYDFDVPVVCQTETWAIHNHVKDGEIIEDRYSVSHIPSGRAVNCINLGSLSLSEAYNLYNRIVERQPNPVQDYEYNDLQECYIAYTYTIMRSRYGKTPTPTKRAL